MCRQVCVPRSVCAAKCVCRQVCVPPSVCAARCVCRQACVPPEYTGRYVWWHLLCRHIWYRHTCNTFAAPLHIFHLKVSAHRQRAPPPPCASCCLLRALNPSPPREAVPHSPCRTPSPAYPHTLQHSPALAHFLTHESKKERPGKGLDACPAADAAGYRLPCLAP